MSYLNIEVKKIEPVVDELNILLAEYNVYYQNLRGFHWNVVGENFFVLHEKFEELYTDARIKVDEIAERILTLRHHPESRFSEYQKLSKVGEAGSLVSDKKMVTQILADHQQLLKQMTKVVEKAEDAGDEGTVDMIGGYIGSLEKVSWMLDAWLKKSNN
ncbi:DNA starvation/stationary phase protection protein [Maribacter sp. MMG018]|uniref:Dps family protein n=1 Tax=Maribacter sp. MMG018 TaxID=2822688 RepID=UPI001B35F0DB|nr:DNA starvation/stationary phase protection protein [Maribacter sp. MMG018]MBQ4915953.1 DNA starvation/stationary phase protection protein [Maribacter sp. MMG018]